MSDGGEDDGEEAREGVEYAGRITSARRVGQTGSERIIRLFSLFGTVEAEHAEIR